MIHKVDGGFVISADHVWLPGRYESERAARYAFRFCVDLLSEMRDEAIASGGGIITFEAMRKKKADRHGFTCGQGAHRPGWKEGDPITIDNREDDDQ